MLYDDNFQESLCQINDEPMIYFSQFSSKSKAIPSSVSKKKVTELAAEKLIPAASGNQDCSHDDESSAMPQAPGQFQTFEGDGSAHGRKSGEGLV